MRRLPLKSRERGGEALILGLQTCVQGRDQSLYLSGIMPVWERSSMSNICIFHYQLELNLTLLEYFNKRCELFVNDFWITLVYMHVGGFFCCVWVVGFWGFFFVFGLLLFGFFSSWVIWS